MALFLPQYSMRATFNSLSSSNKSFSKLTKAKSLNVKHLTSNSRPTFLLPLKKGKEYLAKNGGWKTRGIDDGSCGIAPETPPSVLDIVQEFHYAINNRDLKKFDDLLSPSCHYEDLIFYIPFQGREVCFSILIYIYNIPLQYSKCL